METLTFESDLQVPDNSVVTVEQTKRRSAFWGVPEGKSYEKGWSARLGNETPALSSDTCVWYFENDEDLTQYTDIPLIARKPVKPIRAVSITQTIAV